MAVVGDRLVNMLQFCAVHILPPYVACRGAVHFFDIFVGQFADYLGRRANDEFAFAVRFSFGHQRASADQAVFADDGAVHHDGLNADE